MQTIPTSHAVLIEHRLDQATNELQPLVAHLEDLFQAAYDEEENKAWWNISYSLSQLYGRHIVRSDDQEDGFPSLFDSSREYLSPVDALLNEVLDEPFHLELPDAGRSFTPGNAHSWAWHLAFQVKLAFLELNSAAKAILTFVQLLPAETRQNAIDEGDSTAAWSSSALPPHLRLIRGARSMVHLAACYPAQAVEGNLIRGPFLEYLRCLTRPNFAALRAAIKKESELGRRYLHEGRLSQTAIDMAAPASPTPGVPAATEPKYLFRDEGGEFRVRFEGESACVPRKGNDGAAYVHAILQKGSVQWNAMQLYHLVHGTIPGTDEDLGEENGVKADNTGLNWGVEESEARKERELLEGVLTDLLKGISEARGNDDSVRERRLLKQLNDFCKDIGHRGAKVKVDKEDNTVSIEGKFLSTNAAAHVTHTRKPSNAIAMAIRDFRQKCAKPRPNGFGMPKFAAHLKQHMRARRYHPPDPVPNWEF